MTPIFVDPTLYIKISNGDLEGLTGVYDDQNNHESNENFERTTIEGLKRFDLKQRMYDDFDFFGTVIKKTASGKF